jgi:hypothetical protein
MRRGEAAGGAEQTTATYVVRSPETAPQNPNPASPNSAAPDAFTNTLHEYLRQSLPRAFAAILAFLCAFFILAAQSLASAQPVTPPLIPLPNAYASAAPSGLMILSMPYPGLARLGSQRPGLASCRPFGLRNTRTLI